MMVRVVSAATNASNVIGNNRRLCCSENCENENDCENELVVIIIIKPSVNANDYQYMQMRIIINYHFNSFYRWIINFYISKVIRIKICIDI